MNKIFLTNDDGYKSELTQDLYSYISQRYKDSQCILMAPEKNCSGISNAVTLNSVISYKKIDATQDKYVVTGYPADCALLGKALFSPVDLVISGPNDSSNLAQDVIYSGTIAAAREAALSNIPALAFSLVSSEFNTVRESIDYDLWHSFLDIWFEELIALAFQHVGNIVSVNIPNPISLELTTATLGKRMYSNYSNEMLDDNIDVGEYVQVFLSNEEDISNIESNTDVDCILQGKAVYTIFNPYPKILNTK